MALEDPERREGPPWPEDFGERLESFMEMAGLSRRDLAQRLGVTEEIVGEWLKGAEPTAGYVHAMFLLSGSVPGGFELLLHGHARDEGEAKG